MSATAAPTPAAIASGVNHLPRPHRTHAPPSAQIESPSHVGVPPRLGRENIAETATMALASAASCGSARSRHEYRRSGQGEAGHPGGEGGVLARPREEVGGRDADEPRDARDPGGQQDADEAAYRGASGAAQGGARAGDDRGEEGDDAESSADVEAVPLVAQEDRDGRHRECRANVADGLGDEDPSAGLLGLAVALERDDGGRLFLGDERGSAPGSHVLVKVPHDSPSIPQTGRRRAAQGAQRPLDFTRAQDAPKGRHFAQMAPETPPVRQTSPRNPVGPLQKGTFVLSAPIRPG